MNTASVIRQHLHDATTSFSIGCLGAIAEFHRAAHEPLELDHSEHLTVASARGSLRVELSDDVLPLAYETLSRRALCWQHGVAFCLPAAQARGARRRVLTEIGPDTGAVRDGDREAVLFDLGLDTPNCDFCVRTDDAALLKALRAGAGRPVLETHNPVMQHLLEHDPHRVVCSALGRAEVYQAIGKTTTPEGPHTHVLPKLLAGGRTHDASVPIPRGQIPCLVLYPASAVFDANGNEHAFDAARHGAFQGLLEQWGVAAYTAEKRRLLKAVDDGVQPGDYPRARSRIARTATRVALRQLKRTTPQDPAVDAWLAFFDAGSVTDAH